MVSIKYVGHKLKFIMSIIRSTSDHLHHSGRQQRDESTTKDLSSSLSHLPSSLRPGPGPTSPPILRTLDEELNLITKLVDLGYNQHHSSIWFQKSIEVSRWLKKFIIFITSENRLDYVPPHRQFTDVMNDFVDQFKSRTLAAYNCIIQNLARTAFMTTGLAFIGVFARIHSVLTLMQSQLKA